jgi:hypothetical protein
VTPTASAHPGEEDTVTMALTVQRPRARTRHLHGLRSVISVSTGPAGVLTAACLLATVFLLAVSDLVTRLG